MHTGFMMRSCLHIAYGWDEGDEVRVFVSEGGEGGNGRKVEMKLRNEWKVKSVWEESALTLCSCRHAL